eukprot:17618-Heterococcus_DN1.PRE.3
MHCGSYSFALLYVPVSVAPGVLSPCSTAAATVAATADAATADHDVAAAAADVVLLCCYDAMRIAFSMLVRSALHNLCITPQLCAHHSDYH